MRAKLKKRRNFFLLLLLCDPRQPSLSLKQQLVASCRTFDVSPQSSFVSCHREAHITFARDFISCQRHGFRSNRMFTARVQPLNAISSSRDHAAHRCAPLPAIAQPSIAIVSLCFHQNLRYFLGKFGVIPGRFLKPINFQLQFIDIHSV